MKQNKENILKITISSDAEKAASEIVEMVNEGFDGCRVTRQDVVSWILDKFRKELKEADIQTIRKAYFDEGLWLEQILKSSKSKGEIPDFLKDMARKHWLGKGQEEGKGRTRASKENSLKQNNDAMDFNEASIGKN